MTTPPSRALEQVAETTYGWSADGKTAAEIAGDILQTRYRMDADVRALQHKLARVKWPAIAAAGLALVSFVIRRLRR